MTVYEVLMVGLTVAGLLTTILIEFIRSKNTKK